MMNSSKMDVDHWFKSPQLPRPKSGSLSEFVLVTEKSTELDERMPGDNDEGTMPNAALINQDPFKEIKVRPFFHSSSDESTDSDPDTDPKLNTLGRQPNLLFRKLVTPISGVKPENKATQDGSTRNAAKTPTSADSGVSFNGSNKLERTSSGRQPVERIPLCSKRNENRRGPSNKPLNLYTLESLNLKLKEDGKPNILNNYLYGEVPNRSAKALKEEMETEIYRENKVTGQLEKVRRMPTITAKKWLSVGEASQVINPKNQFGLWGNPILPSGWTLTSEVTQEQTDRPSTKRELSDVNSSTSEFGGQFPPLTSHVNRPERSTTATSTSKEHIYDGVKPQDVASMYLPDGDITSPRSQKQCSDRLIAISNQCIVTTDSSTGSCECVIQGLMLPQLDRPKLRDVALRGLDQRKRNVSTNISIPPIHSPAPRPPMAPTRKDDPDAPVFIKTTSELEKHLINFADQQDRARKPGDTSSSGMDSDAEESVPKVARRRRLAPKNVARNKKPLTVTVGSVPSRRDIIQSMNEPMDFKKLGLNMTNFLSLSPVQRLNYMREAYKIRRNDGYPT